jgi:methylated-DNA-[protein]-cysteine S-methyltransferase
VYRWAIPSPMGELLLVSDGSALTRVSFGGEAPDALVDRGPFDAAIAWFSAYFAANRPPMNLPVAPAGTPFQQRVWAALVQIPYGATRSYGQIAADLGDKKTVRAVGAANGQNPIAILVPCHRVIGADGSLVGYAGGMHRKRWLLDHEAGRLSLF